MNSLGNSVFMDIIELRWSHAGVAWCPNPMIGVIFEHSHTERRIPCDDIDLVTKKAATRTQRQRLQGHSHEPRNMEDHQWYLQLQEARGFSSRAFRGRMALLTPWHQASSLQNWENQFLLFAVPLVCSAWLRQPQETDKGGRVCSTLPLKPSQCLAHGP